MRGESIPDEPTGRVFEMNSDYLYRSPDGREAWVLFNPVKGLAYIATDIHEQGPPYQAVGFTAEHLRQIADRLDGLRAAETTDAGKADGRSS